MKPEYICYTDENGNLTGETAEKFDAHNANTRKHLAFSLFLFNKDGEFLMTRRASTKKVWPTVLTNSCCGHPAPGEDIEAAIRRRCGYELGITSITDIQCVLPNYSYKTPPYNGIIENEFCPVYVGRLEDTNFTPNPVEVDEVAWLSWDEWKQRHKRDSGSFSFWSIEETGLIDEAVQEYIG